MRPHRDALHSIHQPVLLRETLRELSLAPGLVVVDATVGGGGHSQEILPRLESGGLLIGVDRDPLMVQRAEHRLQPIAARVHESRYQLRQGSYVDLPNILAELQIASVDRVLADLGLSSDQLADASRGFGISTTGPLDLRFDPECGEPAAAWLARATASELTETFQRYGEEPMAGPIADEIVRRRRTSPVRVVGDLVDAVVSVTGPPRRGESHPATRVFQAVRIAINEELQHVARFVDEILPGILKGGGRAVIITFHSLEDRIVKQAFRQRETWEPLSKKPIVATSAERRHNPRSRSAKLRAAVRL
jgi:16S rRNA (cytosine1402-N4)-methyltransferase